MAELTEAVEVDENDPNYDSDQNLSAELETPGVDLSHAADAPELSEAEFRVGSLVIRSLF
jgi:hypothetical protein